MRKKEIASVPASLLPLGVYKAISGGIPVIPLYHIVSNHSPIHIRNLFKIISIQRFLKDIDFFARHYKFADPKDLISESGYFPGKDLAVLTFDDGLSEMYDVVAPILTKKGIPAIFFINNNFIGNKELFYRFKASILVSKLSERISEKAIEECGKILGIQNTDTEKLSRSILGLGYRNRDHLDLIATVLEIDFVQYLYEKKPYMNDSQLKELVQKGFSIGAHGHDHQIFNELKPDGMVNEIRESVHEVVNNYSQSARFFAFPFTDSGVPAIVLKTIHDPQNKIVELSFGTAGLKNDIMKNHLQRIPMEAWGKSASSIIKAEYLSRVLRISAGRNTIKRD